MKRIDLYGKTRLAGGVREFSGIAGRFIVPGQPRELLAPNFLHVIAMLRSILEHASQKQPSIEVFHLKPSFRPVPGHSTMIIVELRPYV